MFKSKNIILIILSIVLVFTFASCNINSSDTDFITDTGNNQTSTDTDVPSNPDKTLKTVRQNENVELYPMYKLGNYYGNGFTENVEGDIYGIIQYKIMQSWRETAGSTDYGAGVDKSLFDSHYVLALRFLYAPDMKGFLGIKNFSVEDDRCYATALYTYSANSNLNTAEYYQYVAVPISHLENWNDEGIMELRKEEVDYVFSHKIEVDTNLYKEDGHSLLFTRESLENYIKENNLPMRIESIGVTPNYLVCFSKGKFDGEIAFTQPAFQNGELTITRDFSISNGKEEKAYLNIIPLRNSVLSDISQVNQITLTLRNVDNGTLLIKNYKIAEAEVNYNTENLYPTFNGGVFYGLDFNIFENSAYTVIENFDELNEKTEFIIDEDEFKNYCVIVLKLVGEKENRIGFSDLTVTESGIEIVSHISPYYDSIQSGSNEIFDKVDILLEDSEDDKTKVEYEYILVLKSKLNVIKQRTGNLTVKTDETFNTYNTSIDDSNKLEEGSYSLSIYPYNKDNSDIKSGDTWQIKTNLQLRDFSEKYGLDLKKYDNTFYNYEYIAIYLENHSLEDIIQWSVTENNSVLFVNYLVKELNEQTKNENIEKYFIVIEKPFHSDYNNVSVEYTKINYNSVQSLPKENEINSYDFYPMHLYKNINWKFKQISDFNTLRNVFNEYGKEEKANGITADGIFLSNVFDENYIVAVHLTEGSSGTIKNTFYNARVSADGTLHLYSFKNSMEGDDAIYAMLYFIIIPKTEIPSYISNVKIQNTNEIIYNGPFEHVSIIGRSENEVKIEGTHLIINSETELERFFANYDDDEKLQNVDFENNFVLALNRKYYKYSSGSFVNFKTTLNGTSSITFVRDTDREIIKDEWSIYQLDLIIIPKQYLKYEIDYFYVRYTQDSLKNIEKAEDICDTLEDLT